ncbi:hypothetical protein K461DRAFT_303008 [Myriangium duriaei CBS 260.36]|uniref:Uncharacterized protein n=1 Tax=Myriangium duriaei CBS 260.36 TaxID=1168546 RepID=A0A9P4MF69_9PEZI|nr:hypothetical protein K461DRAFT_303008 [Myriangium duriaei CBS 260.36]
MPNMSHRVPLHQQGDGIDIDFETVIDGFVLVPGVAHDLEDISCLASIGSSVRHPASYQLSTILNHQREFTVCSVGYPLDELNQPEAANSLNLVDDPEEGCESQKDVGVVGSAGLESSAVNIITRTSSDHQSLPSGKLNHHSSFHALQAASILPSRAPASHHSTTLVIGHDDLQGSTHPCSLNSQSVEADLNHNLCLMTDPAIPFTSRNMASVEAWVESPAHVRSNFHFLRSTEDPLDEPPSYSEYPQSLSVPTANNSDLSRNQTPITSPTQSMANLHSLRTLNQNFVRYECNTKPWREKTWKEKRSTRLCGLRFDWLVFALGTILFTGIVSGAVIGGVYIAHNKAIKK